MSDDTYEIYAIKYAHSDRRSSENFLGGDPHDVPMPLDYFVWAIIGAKRTFILDTGFDASAARQRKRQLLNPVNEGLRAIGIEPDVVQDVIISHMHYDHAGNEGMFPNARFHLQDLEMQFATGRCMCHPVLRHTFEISDVMAMVRRVFEDRVVFHDGVDEIAPGLIVHHIGGHSKGLQSVRVRTRRGWVVLASDAAHFYAHFHERRVFPVLHNVEEVLEGYRTLEALASSPQHIVPGHDPRVLELYPAAKPNLAGWIVRLDADPKVYQSVNTA